MKKLVLLLIATLFLLLSSVSVISCKQQPRPAPTPSAPSLPPTPTTTPTPAPEVELRVQDPRAYFLSYRYEEGKLSLIYVRVERTGQYFYSWMKTEAAYKCEVVSFENEVLLSFWFKARPKLNYDYSDPKTGELKGGEMELQTGEAWLRIPYFTNGRTINIYDPDGTRVLSVDVGHLAEP